jgi:hypothetical protein
MIRTGNFAVLAGRSHMVLTITLACLPHPGDSNGLIPREGIRSTKMKRLLLTFGGAAGRAAAAIVYRAVRGVVTNLAVSYPNGF